MRIAITGHRPNKLGNDYDLKSDLINLIKNKLQEIIDKEKPNELISGMALGIDTLWANLALDNEIKLIAALPCKNQDKIWPDISKLHYRNILNNSLTTIVYVTEGDYTRECMQLRNEWMVDNCDLLIAVWDGTSGGTANCVSYAKSQSKKMIIINPKEILQTNLVLKQLNKLNQKYD